MTSPEQSHSPQTLAYHCDCNCVPRVLRFGEMSDVAGLIAPRPLLIVNGEQAPLFPRTEVEKDVNAVRRIYAASASPEGFSHAWSAEGHRFYPEIMWPHAGAASSRA